MLSGIEANVHVTASSHTAISGTNQNLNYTVSINTTNTPTNETSNSVTQLFDTTVDAGIRIYKSNYVQN